MRTQPIIHGLRLSTLLATLLAITACTPTTPQWDSRFGESVRLVRSQQVLDPGAGGDEPVNGIDGATGRESIGRYRSTFREPPPPASPFAIGVSR